MISTPGMCQAYPVYTSGAPEDVSTALHGSGEGSLRTQVHAPCGTPLYEPSDEMQMADAKDCTARAVVLA